MTALRIPLPIQESLRDFLADLLGRGVAAAKTEPIRISTAAEAAAASVSADGDDEVVDVDDAPDPQTLAIYVDDDGRPRAVVVVELALGAAAGAALALVPAVMLDEVNRTGKLPENLAENLHEVLNIFVSLLNSSATPHVGLRETVEMPAELPDDVAAILDAPERRRDFVVTIEGYGEGCMAVLAGPGFDQP